VPGTESYVNGGGSTPPTQGVFPGGGGKGGQDGQSGGGGQVKIYF